MKIYKGESGLNQTWQTPFLKEIKCKNCAKGKAKIMFVVVEGKDGFKNKKFICDLHETTGKKGGLWLHDVCAVAVYLCQNCLEVSGEINQA